MLKYLPLQLWSTVKMLKLFNVYLVLASLHWTRKMEQSIIVTSLIRHHFKINSILAEHKTNTLATNTLIVKKRII